MASLNLVLPTGTILLEYSYDAESMCFVFENDLHINEWTVYKIINNCYPCNSCYKHDFKAYMEFAITDRNGVTEVIKYYYDGGEHDYSYTGVDGVIWWNINRIECVKYFLSKSSIFKCADWEDHKADVIIRKIKAILNTNIDKCKQLKRVQALFDTNSK